MEVLTSAIFLCELDPNQISVRDSDEKWLSTRARLSALIDQGRFFLPNEEPDVHGRDKPYAYRGYRPPSLDRLVASYEVLNALKSGSLDRKATHSRLWKLRKQFVSEIQQILNPREREKEMKELQQRLKH